MIPYQTQIIVGIAVACVAGGIGWNVRGWKEDAARLDAEREAQANYVRIADAYGRALTDAQEARTEDQQQAAADRLAFDRRLRDERRKKTPLVVCGDGLRTDGLAGDRGDPRFTAEFVGLWNAALKIGLPAALRAD